MALTVAILACTWSGLTHSELRPNYIDCIPSRVKEKLLSRSSRSRPSPRWRGPWPAILRPEARCEREEVSGSEAAQRSGNVHPPDVPDRSAGADLPPQLAHPRDEVATPAVCQGKHQAPSDYPAATQSKVHLRVGCVSGLDARSLRFEAQIHRSRSGSREIHRRLVEMNRGITIANACLNPSY
jgi:hypothetical protein